MTPAKTPTTYLIATAGSHGDVLPFMALADGLTKLGHHAIVYGTPLFAKFTPKGVQFVPVGTNELYYQALSALNDNRPLSSIRQIVAVMTNIIPLIINEMEKDIVPQKTVVIGSVMNPAPHIFAEKYRLPLVNVHLSPLAVYSVHRMGRALPILDNLTKWQNPTLNRLFWRWVDWAVFRPNFTKPINRLRADYGLSSLAVPMIEWINQADLVLGLFDEHFAPRQPDWADIKMVGFPFYQQAGELSDEIGAFLKQGDSLYCSVQGRQPPTLTPFSPLRCWRVKNSAFGRFLSVILKNNCPPICPTPFWRWIMCRMSRFCPKWRYLYITGALAIPQLP